MKVLVTGASGFLGRAICARLSRDHRVTGWSHRVAGTGLESVDLREGDAVRAVLAKAGPEVVIHCAAYRDPDFSEMHPRENDRLNVGATRSLCEGLPPSVRLVFISTDYVFDGTRPPYHEEDPVSPAQEYGKSKVQGEQVVLQRPGSLVVRVPLLIGVGSDFASSGFLSQIASQHLRAEVPHDCDHVLVRYPTWICDVADAVAFLTARQATGVFHMSGDDRLTRYEAVCLAAQIWGASASRVRPSRTVLPRAAARPLNSHLATDKIRALGFRGFTPFRDVLEIFHRAFPAETTFAGAGT